MRSCRGLLEARQKLAPADRIPSQAGPVASRAVSRREVDVAGDGFLAVFDGSARAVRCGLAICEDARALGFDVCVGVHTGDVELDEPAVRGIAVHIGARVAAEAAPNDVLVSGTVKDLVAGSGLAFEARGQRELKGVPGAWHLYSTSASESPAGAQASGVPGCLRSFRA